MATKDTLVYWLDEQNNIASIIGPWDSFALENGGENVISAQILGKPLEAFIADDQTRMHINVLVSSVRTLGKEIERDYRCDSPTEKRYMKMHIKKDIDGKVKISNTMLKCEPKDHRVEVKVPDIQVHQKPTPRCSLCNMIKLDGQWIEDSDAASLQLIQTNKPLSVIYTVCDNCYQISKPAD